MLLNNDFQFISICDQRITHGTQVAIIPSSFTAVWHLCKFVNATFCLGPKLESSLAFTFKGQHLAPYSGRSIVDIWSSTQMRKSIGIDWLSVWMRSTYNIHISVCRQQRHCANTLYTLSLTVTMCALMLQQRNNPPQRESIDFAISAHTAP
jgi:hypothetical protein